MNIEQSYASDPEMVAEFIQELYTDTLRAFDAISEFQQTGGDDSMSSPKFWDFVSDRCGKNDEFSVKYDTGEELYTAYAYWNIFEAQLTSGGREIDRSIRDRLDLDEDASDDEVVEYASEVDEVSYEDYDDLYLQEVAADMYDTFSSYGDVQDSIKRVASDLGIALEGVA